MFTDGMPGKHFAIPSAMAPFGDGAGEPPPRRLSGTGHW